MNVALRDPDDLSRLAGLIRGEKDAMQRVSEIALALDGEMTKCNEAKLGRSKAFVQRRVYVYRDRGLDAAKPSRALGNKCRHAPDDIEKLWQLVIAGPTDTGGNCTLHALNSYLLLRDEFGVMLAECHVRDPASPPLLEPCVVPLHRKTDPTA